MPKRIIVCIDGTENATEVVTRKHLPTNVLRFMRALRSSDESKKPQIVEYIPGVGTDRSAWLMGRKIAAILGRGLVADGPGGL